MAMLEGVGWVLVGVLQVSARFRDRVQVLHSCMHSENEKAAFAHPEQVSSQPIVDSPLLTAGAPGLTSL